MKIQPPLVKIRKIKAISKSDMAELILHSDPWRTLKFTRKESDAMAKVSRQKEILGAFVGKKFVGFALYQFGFLGGGYLQNLVVSENYRGLKIGEKLMREMESLVFARSKNLYLCVSSFNRGGQKFYRRLGYKKVGVLKALLVKKHDEFIFRKTKGPIRE